MSLQVTVNGEQREVARSMTLAALLNDLGLDPRHVAVEVNEQLVPRGRHAEYELAEGDRLEVVTLVGGG